MMVVELFRQKTQGLIDKANIVMGKIDNMLVDSTNSLTVGFGQSGFETIKIYEGAIARSKNGK